MPGTKSSKTPAIKIRRWKPEDIPAIVACQCAAYARFRPEELCNERHYQFQLTAFPEGQILAEVGGKIVGYAASLIVQLDDDSPWYSYSEITGVATFSTHNPSGDTLYGADIAVHPDWRGKGVAAKLYEGRRKLLERFNLRRMVAGGRIPGYKAHAGRMTPEQYVVAVQRGELKDQALNAHLKAGYEVRGIHFDYLTDDSSMNYATFLEYPNPKFDPNRRRIAGSPIRRHARRIRVCAAQYQMRRISTWEEFENQVEFYVTTADEYHCHFLLFPELFTAQLFCLMPADLETDQAVRELTTYTTRYLEMFKEMAERSGLYIIGGSHPITTDDGHIRNVAHLFSPRGDVYTQDKLHITPAERKYWGIQPGTKIQIFNTSLARIAIVICYDIEFPELARLLTLAGVEVIFVPFSTDDRQAYLRVRYTAQARAVENMIYTVIAGNIGNLPQVKSFLINYGQAAVLTPSDIAFPVGATAAEAEPNTETVVISDLDLGNLALQRELGSVRPLHDRRPDLYDLSPNEPIQTIRTS